MSTRLCGVELPSVPPRLIDLRTQLTSQTASELLGFLKDWWLAHIQDEDKKYAVYLQRMRVWDGNLLRR